MEVSYYFDYLPQGGKCGSNEQIKYLEASTFVSFTCGGEDKIFEEDSRGSRMLCQICIFAALHASNKSLIDMIDINTFKL